ncbi:MAG: alanine dehydrogenase [Bacteroidetes bacterium]|nr:alanine dehydrogenase [Bacteroidota bacterium]HET6245777.1 alanine dehydrogenase [Bacteroidia bacterium]
MSPKDAMFSFAKSAGLMPQEEMLEVSKRKSSLYIGIPKETSFQENRVPLVPDAIALLINNGHDIVVETNAGKAANFHDKDYSDAGAKIAYSTDEVYKADMILKVEPPSLEEIEMMQHKQTLISALQLTIQPENFVKKLMDKKVTAIAYDFIKDEEGIFPIVRSMSEIAGNTSILIAAEYLSNVNNGQGSMLGGISGVSPTEVVILGAGTVGEYAARAALGLGASVKVFDNSIFKLRRLQNNLGLRIFTSVLQPKVLMKSMKTADVVIGSIRAAEGRTPLVVSEEMVGEMKFGSVIIDVSIDQGGCFETSRVTNHTNPVFRKYGVIHYCVPNIASRVSRTASYALSNVFAPILLNIGEEGGVNNVLRRDKGVRHGVYIYNGILTNKYLGETFNLPYKDIDLMMAAY